MERLELAHVYIIMVCIKAPVLVSEMETWLRLYKNLKDYLYIALLDKDISQQSYEVLFKFFGISALTDKIIEETGDIIIRALDLLFPLENKDVDIQKQFTEFINEKVNKGNRQIKDMFINSINKFKAANPDRIIDVQIS